MQNAFFRIGEAGKRGKSKPIDAPFAEFMGSTKVSFSAKLFSHIQEPARIAV
jgi:hypothetical protein